MERFCLLSFYTTRFLRWLNTRGFVLVGLRCAHEPFSLVDITLVFSVTIESTGALPPEQLFTEAVKILEDKCVRVITELS